MFKFASLERLYVEMRPKKATIHCIYANKTEAKKIITK